MLEDEYDDDGSDSGSAVVCAFPFRFDDSVGYVDDSVSCVDDSVCQVCGVGYGIFVPIGIESIGDFFLFVIFVPIGVE